MTSFVLANFNTTPQTLTGTEHGILVPSASLVTSGPAITVSPGTGPTLTQISVGGTIVSHSQNARTIQGTAFSASLDIGAQGSISSLIDHALLLTIQNQLNITNYGIVKGHLDGLQTNVSGGIGRDTIVNHGVFSGTEGPAIDAIFSDGIFSVINTGSITSAESAAIRTFDSTASAATALIKNSGDIVGGGTSGSDLISYDGSDAVDIVLNAGTMIGDIRLDNNNDRYDGAGGVVIGRVMGLFGNDTLLGGSEADLLDGGEDDDLLVGRGGDDELFGYLGNDYLLGGSGNDSMNGWTGNDTMNGQEGDDTLLGGDGDDAMTGGAGADEMLGGADNDTMNGQEGEDVLEGEAGNDILRGGNGDDALAGGEGFDLLTGGAGADSFVFRAVSETAVGALRDQILDFEQGGDLIVVAGLSPGVFEFRGTASFAPSGNPELRLLETSTGSTIVQIDNNGDGLIDAEIRVANVTGLTAEDFVL